MLQQFLDAELLGIGDEVEKFGFLEKAVPTIVKSLKENREKLVSFTLVALDADALDTEPAFVEVEAAVKEHWKTLRSKFKEVPRQIFRAVILEALEQLAKEDEVASAIIWLTGSSFLLYGSIEERALPLCRGLLGQLGDKLEEQAVAVWALETSTKPLKLPALNVKLPDAKAVKVNVDEVTKGMAAAVGPQDQHGTPLNSPNPHWPNQFQAWAYQFAPRAALAVAGAVDKASKEILASLGTLEEGLSKYGAAINTSVQKAVDSAVSGVIAQQRRAGLMWWKETLYSEARRRSYRGLNGSESAFLMAYDLHQNVPSFSPQSVEFLLRETFRSAIGGDQRPNDLVSVLSELGSDKNKLRLADLLTADENQGRVTLTKFIVLFLSGKVKEADLKKKTGLPANGIIGAEDLAVWIFRDLQARSLVEEA